MKPTSKPDKPSSFRTLEIKTSWGLITLILENGRAVALNLPHLDRTPPQPFVTEGGLLPDALLRPFMPAGIPEGTPFQQAVWSTLSHIPRGQTRTYGELAVAIGRPRAVRAVAAACGANPLPLLIPCHRVVARNGPGGFSAGLPWKKLLLELERPDATAHG